MSPTLRGGENLMQTGRRLARLGFVAPLVVAAALTGAAVFTVNEAGCDDPVRLVPTQHGPVLVGGCSLPGLVTPGHSAPHGSADDEAAARRG